MTVVLLGTSSCLVGAEKPYILQYDRAADLDEKGWEFNSLPLGNGYVGVNVFGGVEQELWQFSDKALWVMAPPKISGKNVPQPGLSSLAELRLTFPATAGEQVTDYRRSLDLRQAVSGVSYVRGGISYQREMFTSFPDRCCAARLTASMPGKVAFRLQAVHPYLGEYRKGQVRVEGDHLVMTAITEPYQLAYEVRIQIVTRGGSVRATAAGETGDLMVDGADEACVYVTNGTNYRLESQVFLNEDPKKLAGFAVPSERISGDLHAAVDHGWQHLRDRHVADHRALFERVELDLGGQVPTCTTDVLLGAANAPVGDSRYLEELYFQYGRYLLIASSRPGTLPANLQGTWNMKQCAPWTGGYWANINIQMNYWPAFVTNLEETFQPYYDYFRATFAQQQRIAAEHLAKRKIIYQGDAGWTAGTGNSAFQVSGPGPTSGDGTGPFIALLLWDWYAFTEDRTALEKAWPFFLEGSRFLANAMRPQEDGRILCSPSYSPEQGTYNAEKKKSYISIPGCAYDQQLATESYRLTLKTAQILGKSDPILEKLRAQLPHLDPVLIGTSGQIKEFPTENAYGEFGARQHRHISQLIGLYPGTIMFDRPEWIAAARTTLDLRGDLSTGWAMAHRLNAWARLQDGERAHSLLRTLLSKGTMPNLWDTHPPFQIDGNFGGTSGIAEMLLQSHTGVIDLLPALPKAWASGSVRGLRARGDVTVDIDWSEGRVTSFHLRSRESKAVKVRIQGKISLVQTTARF